MIQDINTSIGEFDVSDENYLFMQEFVANAVYDDYDPDWLVLYYTLLPGVVENSFR